MCNCNNRFKKNVLIVSEEISDQLIKYLICRCFALSSNKMHIQYFLLKLMTSLRNQN
jgi:hypothetical protein